MPMSLRTLIVPLAGGATCAALWAGVLTGGLIGPLLSLVLPLPLLLVGLSSGIAAAGIASIVAAAILAVMSGFQALVVFALAMAVPSLVVIQRSMLARTNAKGQLEWYPPGGILAWLAGLILAGLVGVSLLALSMPGGLQGVVEGMFRPGTDAMVQAMQDAGQNVTPEQADASLRAIAGVFPGVAGVWIMLQTVMNAILAQVVLTHFGKNARPPMRMMDIELPAWVGMALGVTGLMAWFAPGAVGFYAQNAAIILALPLLFAGLAVVHAFARSRESTGLILTGFYVVAGLFSGLLILVIGLGLIDEWAGLRRRYAAAGRNGR